MGFDNAHPIAARGRYGTRQIRADHWHRTANDPGKAYAFKDAVTLIEDFFAEVARILTERGVPIDAVAEGPKNERNKP